MRTIKFRGYNRKNNIWLYGSLVHTKVHHFIISDDFYDKQGEDCIVDPETIGQFTGQKDKNGTEIFEGDILWVPMPVVDASFWREAIVRWVEPVGAFLLSRYGYDDMTVGLHRYRTSSCEVIGNIHDKKENRESLGHIKRGIEEPK